MMWNPKNVFEANNNIIEFPMELIKEYQFTLKDIATTITIRLFNRFGSDKIHFTQSHHIKTPVQVDAYITNSPYNDDIGSALSQAVSGLTQYYKDAVAEGHRPSGAWLIPNKYF